MKKSMENTFDKIMIVLTIIALLLLIVAISVTVLKAIYQKGRQDFKEELEKNPVLNVWKGGTNSYLFDGEKALKITNTGEKWKVEILNNDLVEIKYK